MAAERKDRDALAWFADELRAHRGARGWTQADVAAKISYSESLIAQVETCRKAATPELAKALDRLFVTPGFTEDAPGTFGRLVVRLRNLLPTRSSTSGSRDGFPARRSWTRRLPGARDGNPGP